MSMTAYLKPIGRGKDSVFDDASVVPPPILSQVNAIAALARHLTQAPKDAA